MEEEEEAEEEEEDRGTTTDPSLLYNDSLPSTFPRLGVEEEEEEAVVEDEEVAGQEEDAEGKAAPDLGTATAAAAAAAAAARSGQRCHRCGGRWRPWHGPGVGGGSGLVQEQEEGGEERGI